MKQSDAFPTPASISTQQPFSLLPKAVADIREQFGTEGPAPSNHLAAKERIDQLVDLFRGLAR